MTDVDPAHAGMILSSFFFGLFPICGPRACGDDPFKYTFLPTSSLWTPRMRG